MWISLTIIVQVRSRVSASSGPARHQYNFTLSYSVDMESNVIMEDHEMQISRKNAVSEMRLSWCLRGLEVTHLRNIPTPAPQVAAWAVQAPTSSPSSWVRQQELWEHSIAPQNKHRVGCFLSSSVDLGHLMNREGPSTLKNPMGCYTKKWLGKGLQLLTYWKWLAWFKRAL